MEVSRELQSVIAQVPGWAAAGDLNVKPLAGLTNTNYLVTVGGQRYVLRLGGENAARLGVDRELELEAVLAAAQAGIAPEVVHSMLPQGHLVTRYIDGRHWSLEEYRSTDTLQRLVDTVKRLHALPLVRAAFSPFRRIERCAEQTIKMGVPLPRGWGEFVEKMWTVEQEQARDPFPWQRFCHNDLFWVNILDDGKVWFVDWEFAGVGDLYFDLAALTYSFDSEKTLSQELQEHVLACYFGQVRAEHWTRLLGMRYVLMFFSAMWARLQYGMQQQGLVRAVEGFDFIEYSNTTLDAMRAALLAG